jgi:hypothetical protein
MTSSSFAQFPSPDGHSSSSSAGPRPPARDDRSAEPPPPRRADGSGPVPRTVSAVPQADGAP